jgi:hypothetical protein
VSQEELSKKMLGSLCAGNHLELENLEMIVKSALAVIHSSLVKMSHCIASNERMNELERIWKEAIVA